MLPDWSSGSRWSQWWWWQHLMLGRLEITTINILFVASSLLIFCASAWKSFFMAKWKNNCIIITTTRSLAASVSVREREKKSKMQLERSRNSERSSETRLIVTNEANFFALTRQLRREFFLLLIMKEEETKKNLIRDRNATDGYDKIPVYLNTPLSKKD